MKITRLDCIVKEFILKEPYTIAYETVTRTENVFLRAETDMGIIGWSCSAPDPEITGEDGASVLANYHNHIEPLLKGSNPFNFARLREDLLSEEEMKTSSMALADILLYDLMAQKAGQPLYKILGGFRDSIATSITIGILPIAETLKKAREIKEQGFNKIKIKGGLNLEEDIEKVHQLRKELGPEIELRFDANQGFTSGEAIHFIEESRKADLSLLEQPTHWENTLSLGKVSRNTHIPVMADESLKSLKDVFHLTRDDLTDMINIKLMKVGGIAEALHINSVARAAGVEVMVGCLDECALGIAAGLHFALSRPNVEFADLDSFLDIRDDPFSGVIILKDGVLYPNHKPGLGVEDSSGVRVFS